MERKWRQCNAMHQIFRTCGYFFTILILLLLFAGNSLCESFYSYSCRVYLFLYFCEFFICVLLVLCFSVSLSIYLHYFCFFLAIAIVSVCVTFSILCVYLSLWVFLFLHFFVCLYFHIMFVVLFLYFCDLTYFHLFCLSISTFVSPSLPLFLSVFKCLSLSLYSSKSHMNIFSLSLTLAFTHSITPFSLSLPKKHSLSNNSRSNLNKKITTKFSRNCS